MKVGVFYKEQNHDYEMAKKKCDWWGERISSRRVALRQGFSQLRQQFGQIRADGGQRFGADRVRAVPCPRPPGRNYPGNACKYPADPPGRSRGGGIEDRYRQERGSYPRRKGPDRKAAKRPRSAA